jgi:hypothetical protein
MNQTIFKIKFLYLIEKNNFNEYLIFKLRTKIVIIEFRSKIFIFEIKYLKLNELQINFKDSLKYY